MTDSHRIIKMLDEGKFTWDELAAVRAVLSRAEREHGVADKKRMTTCVPEELLPDWGCYDKPDTPSAVAALNEAGVALIRAIREGKGVEEAMRRVRSVQEEWSHTGADDTEGREAFWELVRNACVGTMYDPDRLWDRYY